MSPVFADPQLSQKHRVLNVAHDPAAPSFVSRPAKHKENITIINVSLFIKKSEPFLTTLMYFLKGKYQANLTQFQNPKMFVCQQKQKLSSFVINYHPSELNFRLVPLARDRMD